MINQSASHHNEKMNPKKIRILNMISFFLGFSSAIGSYVLSSYFKQASGREDISIFYFVAYVIIQIIFLNLHKAIRRFGKPQVFKYFLLLQVLSTIMLVVIPVSIFGTILLVFNIIVANLSTVGCDIVLECFSTDKMSGRIRGFNLTVLNLGFVLGPFLSTQILETFSFRGIFFAQAIVNLMVLVFAIWGLKGYLDYCQKSLTVWGLLKKVMNRKNIVRIYSLSFVLNFFYALMVIFSPLYLRDLGFTWSELGIVFTIMLLPFVVLQYPMGILADKKMGEKELIIVALSIMAPSVLSIYFIESASLFVWAFVLLLTRVGAAMLEVLTDSYFYKRIDGDDVELIDFYRTAHSAAYIVAAILSAFVLLFMSMKSVFILIFIAIILGFYPAYYLADNKSEAEQ